jgi:hypothetical protein
VKRSHKLALVLLGGASAGAFSGCSQPSIGRPVRISSQCVYVNDYFVPGAGYYHAPFRRFYPFAYNHFDPRLKMYFFGGQWGFSPFQSPINISSPTEDAAKLAEASRTDIVRGGFGSTSGGFSTWS